MWDLVSLQGLQGGSEAARDREIYIYIGDTGVSGLRGRFEGH